MKGVCIACFCKLLNFIPTAGKKFDVTPVILLFLLTNKTIWLDVLEIKNVANVNYVWSVKLISKKKSIGFKKEFFILT